MARLANIQVFFKCVKCSGSDDLNPSFHGLGVLDYV